MKINLKRHVIDPKVNLCLFVKTKSKIKLSIRSFYFSPEIVGHTQTIYFAVTVFLEINVSILKETRSKHIQVLKIQIE